MTDQFDKKVKSISHNEIGAALKPPMAPIIRVADMSVTNKMLSIFVDKLNALILSFKTQSKKTITISTYQEPTKNITRNQSYARANGLYTFCEMTDKNNSNWHDRRDNDSVFLKLLKKGDIHMNERGLICIEPIEEYFNSIRMLKNATQIENVRRILALVGKTLPRVWQFGITFDLREFCPTGKQQKACSSRSFPPQKRHGSETIRRRQSQR